ncbi:MAG: hypothetical protein ACC658_14075 [Acidimicrobiia bacterium]
MKPISYWIDGQFDSRSPNRTRPVPNDGFFIGPDLFDNVTKDMSIYSEGVHSSTQPKMVISRRPDPIHRGVDLGFPRMTEPDIVTRSEKHAGNHIQEPTSQNG